MSRFDQIKNANRKFESDEDKQWRFNYKIGDEWVDSKGNKWKKISDKARVSQNERKIGAIVPYFCPQCGNAIQRVDEFYVVTKGVCLDCDIKNEWEEQKKELLKIQEVKNETN